MKIFLLITLTILLLKRIKDTPTALSSKLYYKKVNENTEELKEKIKNLQIESMKKYGSLIMYDSLVLVTYILIFSLYLFFLVVYLLTSFYLDNVYILILTVTQMILSFFWIKKSCANGVILSTDVEDYKFYRVHNLLDIIVDYIYYPAAIWMLLMMM